MCMLRSRSMHWAAASVSCRSRPRPAATASWSAGCASWIRPRGSASRAPAATAPGCTAICAAAACAVLAGTATGIPKAGDDQVEMVRLLKLTRDSAVKSRTQAINQIKGVLVTAPAELREALTGLSGTAQLDRCAALRPGPVTTPTAAAKQALRSLAHRAIALAAEAAALGTQLDELTTAVAPALRALTGIGPDGAAALLTAAGDNPEPARARHLPVAGGGRGRPRTPSVHNWSSYSGRAHRWRAEVVCATRRSPW